MKKAIWRFRSLAAEAKRVIAVAPSLAAAARQLDVDVATLHRWFREGKLPRPTREQRRRNRAPSQPIPTTEELIPDTQTPAEWGAAMRTRWELATEEAPLLLLAIDAFTLARDMTQKPLVRLTAAARFQQLIKQLDFQELPNAQVESRTPRTPAAQFAGRRLA